MPEEKENLEEEQQTEPVSEAPASEKDPESGSYYYDDAHGYQDFDSEEDEEKSSE